MLKFASYLNLMKGFIKVHFTIDEEKLQNMI